MNIVRKLALALCKTVMVTCIVLFLAGMLCAATVLRPERIKQWLHDSGLYEATTQSVKDQFIEGTDKTTATNPIIKNAVEKSVKESDIQTFAESGIDQTYAWLNGQTKTPQYSLNIQKIKEDFANNVAAGLTARAKTLPTCTYANPPKTNDTLTINCIPPGTDVAAQIEQARQDLLSVDPNSKDANQTEISAQDIKLQTANGPQPYYQALASAQKWYKLLKKLPILTVFVFLLMSVLVLILSKPRYMALRTLGSLTVPYGVMFLIAGYFTPRTIKTTLVSLFNTNDDAVGGALQKLAGYFADTAGSYLVRIGIVLVIVGCGLLAAYFVIKKRRTPPQLKKPPKAARTNPTPTAA